MDLVLDEEQRLLVDSARGFLARYSTPADVRRIEQLAEGHDRALWERVCALGWPGLLHPEDGAPGDTLSFALVARELGRAACTLPLLPSVTLVALPLTWAGEDRPVRRWLAGLADGSVVGAPALMADTSRHEWSAFSETSALRGTRRDSAWALQGTRTLVPYAAVADVLLVPVFLEGRGPALVLVPVEGAVRELRRQAVLGAEPLYTLSLDATVRDDDVVAHGERAVEVLERALDHAAVASTAYAAGLAARALELSVDHAQGREQFGRPIGSFQAVAHRCAEMRAELDAVELLAFRAAWSLDHEGDAALAVGAAKGYATEAIRRIFLHAHQVHGAIGFTMEHDLQLFTRRAKAFELTFGGADRHRERVAVAMGL